MLCFIWQSVSVLAPKLYFKSTSQSQKERERPAPALGGGLVIWVKSPKLGCVMNAGGQSQGRAGLGASWSFKPPVFLGDYLGPGEPSRWARSITVFVVATTLRPAQSKITFNCNAKDIHSWNNETQCKVMDGTKNTLKTRLTYKFEGPFPFDLFKVSQNKQSKKMRKGFLV